MHSIIKPKMKANLQGRQWKRHITFSRHDINNRWYHQKQWRPEHNKVTSLRHWTITPSFCPDFQNGAVIHGSPISPQAVKRYDELSEVERESEALTNTNWQEGKTNKGNRASRGTTGLLLSRNKCALCTQLLRMFDILSSSHSVIITTKGMALLLASSNAPRDAIPLVMAGFPNLGDIDILGYRVLCCRGHRLYYRMFRSIHGL